MLERAREVGSGGFRPEGLGVGLVGEHDQEDVLDGRQVRAPRARGSAGAPTGLLWPAPGEEAGSEDLAGVDSVAGGVSKGSGVDVTSTGGGAAASAVAAGA